MFFLLPLSKLLLLSVKGKGRRDEGRELKEVGGEVRNEGRGIKEEGGGMNEEQEGGRDEEVFSNAEFKCYKFLNKMYLF